tara:strand:+ start:715 stop:900 length:186 start_codon:yes stop_codon:yes gene_type:complete
MKCVLCLKEIVLQGHNASPLIEGECCSPCNDVYVQPVRLDLAMGRITYEQVKELLVEAGIK